MSFHQASLEINSKHFGKHSTGFQGNRRKGEGKDEGEEVVHKLHAICPSSTEASKAAAAAAGQAVIIFHRVFKVIHQPTVEVSLSVSPLWHILQPRMSK